MCSVELWVDNLVHYMTGLTIDVSLNSLTGALNMSMCFYLRQIIASVSMAVGKNIYYYI